MTDFKENVYAAVALIPKGRVATYGQVAEMAGCPGAARAVGNAIHTNTDPVKVPCHRVVDASGRVGSHYGMGGPAVQRQRLEAEGIVFAADGTVDLARYGVVIEHHPLEPFLPPTGKVLFLGSFPPPQSRWSMDFFYPNFINDFWRIWGWLAFGSKDYFVGEGKHFDKERIVAFCRDRGLAFFDTARKVCRLKGNASDEFLLILEPTEVGELLVQMPSCRAVVTTGGKSSEELAAIVKADGVPAVGEAKTVVVDGREVMWYRMPSSSRAYPMRLEQKAAHYRVLWDLVR